MDNELDMLMDSWLESMTVLMLAIERYRKVPDEKSKLANRRAKAWNVNGKETTDQTTVRQGR